MIRKEEILPFVCKQTGKCCVNNEIPLNPKDIFRIARSLNVKPKILFAQKIITYRIIPSNYWMEPILNSRESAICPFLEKDSNIYNCSIYENRPFACRLFPIKFEPDLNLYHRSEKSETRCHECIAPGEGEKLVTYLENSGIEELSSFYVEYRFFIDRLIRAGFNLHDIKNKKEKQKIFFQIQSILYETYPKEEEESFPWEELKTEINNLVEIK